MHLVYLKKPPKLMVAQGDLRVVMGLLEGWRFW